MPYNDYLQTVTRNIHINPLIQPKICHKTKNTKELSEVTLFIPLKITISMERSFTIGQTKFYNIQNKIFVEVKILYNF